jgi:small multidrug resistance pump
MFDLPGWIFLSVAILSEVSGTTLMKLSDGYTKLLPSVGMFLCYGISLSTLTYAVQQIDIGVAYAIWSGVGTILITLIGVALFNQSLSLLNVVSILLIVAGVAGLHLHSDAR